MQNLFHSHPEGRSRTKNVRLVAPGLLKQAGLNGHANRAYQRKLNQKSLYDVLN